jgi:hypothetical protein
MAKNSESRTLKSCSEVMGALGGAVAVARLTGARYGTVWPWEKASTFPSRYFLVMTWALRRKRLRAPASLWGMVTTPEMERAA